LTPYQQLMLAYYGSATANLFATGNASVALSVTQGMLSGAVSAVTGSTFPKMIALGAAHELFDEVIRTALPQVFTAAPQHRVSSFVTKWAMMGAGFWVAEKFRGLNHAE